MEADNGEIAAGTKTIVKLAHVEFVHVVVCIFAQYVVLIDGTGITRELLLTIRPEPQLFEYHPVLFPVPPVVLKVIVPGAPIQI